MSVINDFVFAFTMPAVKNSRIKNAIEEHVKGQRPTVSWYAMKSAEGKEFAFRLIINKNLRKIDSDNIADRYYVFATMQICSIYEELKEYVPCEYRNRWYPEAGCCRRQSEEWTKA